MKREFLSELGLEEETIDQIMAEYGKTINPLKEDRDSLSAKLESLEEQIKERDEQLNELAEKAEGHDDLKGQIESLKQANAEAKQKYEQKLQQQTFDFALDKALMEAKARNPIAVKALLDLETIKLGDDGELIGLSEQLEKRKESDWYLFEDAQFEDDGGSSERQTPKHIAGQSKKLNTPKKNDPYEQGRLKALERFQKEEA